MQYKYVGDSSKEDEFQHPDMHPDMHPELSCAV